MQRFEDIIAWQKSRALTREVDRVTKIESCAQDFMSCSQIQRASVSVMSNIAKGFARRTTKQFAHFLTSAKSSCAEDRSSAYVGFDVGHLTSESRDLLLEMTNKVVRVLAGVRTSLQSAATHAWNLKLGARNFEEAHG